MPEELQYVDPVMKRAATRFRMLQDLTTKAKDNLE